MEEDILQRVIQEIKTYGDLDGIEDIRPLGKALENLIARNKELEKINTDLLLRLEMKKVLFVRKDKTTNKLLSELYIRKDEFEKDYIPKSKVREKIEELKGKIEYYKKCANIAKDRVEKRLMCDQINELKTAIKYFEQLLQEGDK